MMAGPVLRHHLLGLSLGGHDDDAAAVTEGGLHRVVEALGHPGFGYEPVHDRVDGVLLLLVEADLVLEAEDDAVDADPGEPRLPHLIQDVAVFSLALLHERGQEEELRPRGDVGDLVDDLL